MEAKGGVAKGLPPQPPKAQQEDGDTRDLRGDTEAGPLTQSVHSSTDKGSLSSPFGVSDPRREEDFTVVLGYHRVSRTG